MTNESSHENFHGLNIAPGILQTLERMKFKTPTPIQQKAIPLAIEGNDIIGIAQTGTGKTMAFGIPMVQRLAQTPGTGLVLVPTRELALQADDSIRKLGHAFGMNTAVLIGGAPMFAQIQLLRRRPRVIIATPGRFLDHMERKTVDISTVKFLVLDEADRMLDMGFAPQINEIVRQVPKLRQTLLFSATMPEGIVKIATQYMKLPLRVEVARAGTVAEKVTQELFIVRDDAKKSLLLKLLEEYHGSVLLFMRMKSSAKRITMALRNARHNAAEIHSDRSLGQRREALEGFKSGKYRVLVATDIAARGIDVKGIELVINYDLPDDVDNYIHRIGRTGRAGLEGRAISFATPSQGADVRAIEKLMRLPLKVVAHPEFPPEKFSHSAGGGGSSHRFGGGGGHRGGNKPRSGHPWRRHRGPSTQDAPRSDAQRSESHRTGNSTPRHQQSSGNHFGKSKPQFGFRDKRH